MTERNPNIEIKNQLWVQTIGDPHLGRKFNVNLNRRGEYEERQYQEFERLLSKRADITVIVGDLFDKRNVDEADIIRTAQLLKKQTRKTIILRGNHDDTKNITEKSSFDLLVEMLVDYPNVSFITDEVMILPLSGNENIAFCGWCFDKTLREQIEGITDKIVAIFCHLDRISYGDDTNVIPFEYLKYIGVELVVNGHEHKPYFGRIEGVDYIGTGSLLPYSHAEHSESEQGEIYITIKDLEEIHKLAESGDLKDKHVRVYVTDPTTLPQIDCLSLQVNKLETISEAEVVVIENYSLKNIFQETAKVNNLPPSEILELWSEISALGGDQ